VRASASIEQMAALISELEAKGLAYERDGWVYYDVSADPGFGALAEASGIHGYDGLLSVANERGNFPDDARKSDPLDFVLWQAQQPGEPAWPSPWGDGRPGWHIECSALATRFLGPQVTIHGGGSDLIFPHHTCEIAQSEHATGVQPFVQVWMHCAMVGLDGEKMSKSLGNLILADDLLKTYTPDAIRLLLLAHHYRRPWEYLTDEMEAAATRAARYSAAIHARDVHEIAQVEDMIAQRAVESFGAALDSDLDTPTALAALDTLATAALEAPTPARVAALRELGGILGLTYGDINPPAATWTLE